MRRKIRTWLGRAEEFRRHFVVVDEQMPDPVRAADSRHGVLGLVGHGIADDSVKTSSARME